MWSIGDLRSLGSLIWIDGRPILTLFLEADSVDDSLFADPDLPLFRATKPPLQVTITGSAPHLGTITLECCARYNVRTNRNFHTGNATYRLDFLPTTIWAGSSKSSVDGRVTSAIGSDTRLAGFFGTPGLNVLRKYDPSLKEIYNVLGNPEHIWTAKGPEVSQVPLGSSGWELRIYTDASETSSATSGHTINSLVNLSVSCSTPTSISEASKHLNGVEDIISTFSIESFTFQFEQYVTDDFERIALVWRLGENRLLFRSPMRHQILIDLEDGETLRDVCRKWFTASPTISLSRWLFVRALRESEDGLARFVAVAQAFEVLGRELGPTNRMPKILLRRAAALIKNALKGQFDESFIERATNLIKSSNKASYSDVLAHIIGGAVERLNLGSIEQVQALSKKISETRNAVIHMSDDDKGKLSDAFARVNKLSLQLCFWYAVCQADQMKLSMPNIGMFLLNNRNARHGLPNEVLERD